MTTRESIGQYVQIPDLPVSGTLNGSEWIEIVQAQGGVLKSYRVTLETLKVIGQDGLSAFEVAQQNGFEGTVQAWLNSLVGKSAYDVVRGLHPEVDTEQKFVEFITGPSGKSAYEIAKAVNPQIGSEPEWIDSLYGDQGPQGEKGSTGPKGDKGDKGDNGAPGAPGTDGLQGERGPQGVQGERGQQGIVGNTGIQGLKGDKGDPGNPGAPGTPGAEGAQGPQGDQGPQGLQGPKGDKGEPGSGGGGGGFLYWEEKVALGVPIVDEEGEPIPGTRNGRVNLDLGPNIKAIEDKFWDGEPHSFIDLNLYTTDGGSLNIQYDFEPRVNDVNLSKKFLTNRTGDNGYGFFIDGGDNLIDIQIPVSTFNKDEDPVEWNKQEAMYGSIIIGGLQNIIEAPSSAIIHSRMCCIKGYDNNGDGDAAAMSFIGFSSDTNIQAIQSIALACSGTFTWDNNESEWPGSGYVYKTFMFGCENSIIESSHSCIVNDEAGKYSGDKITSFGGSYNNINRSDRITLIGTSYAESKLQKNIVVIGGDVPLLSGSPIGANIPYELNTVIENATYSSQKRRVIGRMKYGQETATPLVYIPHGKTFERSGDILTSHPSIFRVRVEMYLFVYTNSHNESMIGEREYAAYELSYTAVKFTEVDYSSGEGVEETKLKPLNGSIRIIDLKTGDYVNDGYSPFYLREIDEYGDTDWLGADFTRINQVLSQPDDTPWVVSYVADVTEVHHGNDARGAGVKVPV